LRHPFTRVVLGCLPLVVPHDEINACMQRARRR
jgi:hypothetical protein